MLHLSTPAVWALARSSDQQVRAEAEQELQQRQQDLRSLRGNVASKHGTLPLLPGHGYTEHPQPQPWKMPAIIS